MNDNVVPVSEPCALCGGSGWERIEGSSSVRRCQCRLQARSARLAAQAEIPARYEDCTLENFEPRNDSQNIARLVARSFVKDYPHFESGPGAGLLIMGNCGVGKTHLAVAILRGLIEAKGALCVFSDFRELLREIQNSYNPVSGTSELRILEPVLNAEVLALDDLGASKTTEWVRDTVAYIINARYNEKRTTLFTTNYLDNPSAKAQETLTDRIGVRMRSRLYEMCRLVQIMGDEDHRRDIRSPDRWLLGKK